MKKLIEIVVKNAEIKKDALVELILSQQYPEITMEYLLGVYEIPEIPETPINKSFRGDEANKTFTSFDVINQKVNYQYNPVEKMYFETEESTEGFSYYDITSEQRVIYISKTVVNLNKVLNSSCDLSTWLNDK